MRIVNGKDTAFYRPRKPWETPLYRLIEDHFDEFERVYPDRFQRKYGFWRPVVRRAVNDYLDCSDPREGFARVRCPDCRHVPQPRDRRLLLQIRLRRMHLPLMPPKAHTGHLHQHRRESRSRAG